MNATLDEPAQRLLSLAADGRLGPAIDYALELMVDGTSLDHLITSVLCPVQQHVGDLWQQNSWSAAQEHAATSVIDGVLGALAFRSPTHTSTRGTVLVACVEGEYHSVPARMGVERLRLDGWDVTFLGASLPAEDLKSFAANESPDIVVLSCTLPLFLPGAARSVAAVADLGLIAVVAGAGFGDTPNRADRIGASGWIGPTSDPTAVLEGSLRRPVLPLDADTATAELELCKADVIADCMDEMFVRIAAMSSYNPRQLAHTRSDLDYILRYLGVAIDMREPALFDEFVTWLTHVLSRRGVPPTVLAASLDIVGAVTGRAGFLQAAAICSSASDRLCRS